MISVLREKNVKEVWLGVNGTPDAVKIRPFGIKLKVSTDFDSDSDVTSKGFELNTKGKDWAGVYCNGGALKVSANHNDAGGSCIIDVSQYDHWKAQARIYTQGTSRGGDQRFTVGGGELPEFRADDNVIGHTLCMTSSSGYRGPSGIGTGSSQGGEYGQYFTGTYVYEIEYDNGTYTCTRYNDTQEVTEESTYTHRKTFTGGKAGYVGIWLRAGYTTENYNRADWFRLYY